MVRATVNSRRRLQNHGVIVHATINEQRRLQWLTYMDLVLSFMPQLNTRRRLQDFRVMDYSVALDINRRELYRL